MSPEVVLALAVFAFVGSITPGPNNIMVLASGLNFGFRRTVPHVAGIGLGFAAMILAIGLGLGAVLERVPLLHTAIRFAGAAYLLYLAWHIAHAGAMSGGERRANPMTFGEAALFQWLNPKGWVLAIGTYSRPDSIVSDATLIAAVFLATNVPSVVIWAGFGAGLQRLLASPARLRVINIAMGVLLAASVLPMLLL